MDELRVSVFAPARLHLGFIDMHGGLGRYFGSLGISLAEIHTDLVMTRDSGISADGPGSDRAAVCAERLITHLQLDGGVHIKLNSVIPEHMGLGSGTQMSLAVATAIARLHGLNISIADLAAVMDRGSRSGIGIGAFMYGGFIVDGGLGADSKVPPIISHMDFPETWRFILVIDNERRGIEGPAEKQAFKHLAGMDERTVADVCRLVLMQVLPAVAESDCRQFGEAITAIQQVSGNYFAEIQGGQYNSPEVGRALSSLLDDGAHGIGQSSWGPTGFAVFASETDARHALERLINDHENSHRLQFILCRARNNKADVRLEEATYNSSIPIS
ncbi:MAG: beta-ribofuranosylaminobenzene 5'-phosphate synthase family protein [Gammaproteobacteria bacterium]